MKEKVKFTEEEIKQYQKNTNGWANPNLIFFEGYSNQDKAKLKLKKKLIKQINSHLSINKDERRLKGNERKRRN